MTATTRRLFATAIGALLLGGAACAKGSDADDTLDVGGAADSVPDSARLVGAGPGAEGADSAGGGSDSGVVALPEAGRPGSSQENDEAQIERLEAEARALAKTAGCERAAQCRTAPLGAKPCGGPRDYLVYCALGTDSAALYRKLAELEKAEKAYNAKSGMMSTCEMLVAPNVEVQGRSCRAAGGAGAGAPRVPAPAPGPASAPARRPR